MEIAHYLAAQLAAAPLVGLAGVSKTITQHNVPSLERRFDHFRNCLRAIGKHEAQFAKRCEALGARVKQQTADAVADPGSPWLASRRYGMSFCLQPLFQAAKLGAFTGAIQALEGHKQALWHERSLHISY